jgi:hypothetical protein
MRPGIIITLVAAAAIGAGIIVPFAFNPLRRSEKDIREWVLHQAPLGSSRNDVLRVVVRRGWKMHPEYRGRFINKSIPTGGFGAELGSYLSWPDVVVDVYWKFGASDRLEEVYVNKYRHNI